MFRFTTLIFIALALFSCNGNKPLNPSNEQALENQDDTSPVKSEPYKYGAGDIVTKGLVDKAGNIWFTTTGDGIYRYNGKTFTNIRAADGLCSNAVSSAIEDKKGLLWFATNKGLCTYDGTRFAHMPLPVENPQSVSPETGFPSRQTEVVLAVTQDRKGHFWLGTNASGAYRYDGKTFTPYLKFHGRLQADSVYNNCVTNILEDRNGNIWFTSLTHGGISRYDGKTMRHFTTNDGLPGDMITSCFEDRAGNIWFGSIQNLEGGLVRYDGQSFTVYTKADGLCDSNVVCFYEDETGKLWIGTGNGVCYFDGKIFTPFTNKDQPLGDIRFILKDKAGNMWFGGRYGILWRYDGKALVDFTYEKRGN